MRRTGMDAEQVALHFLIEKGLRPVLRNYRCRGGELDLVMLDGETLALIEVRLRSNDDFGGAAASVTAKKQRRLVIASKHLLASKPEFGRRRARFDVVAMAEGERGQLKIEWIKDAFRV